MSPTDYAQDYFNMTVKLHTGGEALVSIKDYQNPGPTFVAKYDPMKDGKVNDTGKHGRHWSTVQNVYKNCLKDQGLGTADQQALLSIRAVHKGFGTPREIASVLALAWRYPMETGLSGKGTADDQLQEYIDNWIGLFCAGFVGNFVRERFGHLTFKGDTYIANFAPAPKRRTEPNDVKELDVLVWPDFHHIAIIDSFLKGSVLKAEVVECAGLPYKGLTFNNNVYELRSIAGDKFIVKRGRFEHRFFADRAAEQEEANVN